MTITSTERSRLYYARHRALGLCVLCNSKAALKANGEPGKFCEKHKKQRYSQRDEKGGVMLLSPDFSKKKA